MRYYDASPEEVERADQIRSAFRLKKSPVVSASNAGPAKVRIRAANWLSTERTEIRIVPADGQPIATGAVSFGADTFVAEVDKWPNSPILIEMNGVTFGSFAKGTLYLKGKHEVTADLVGSYAPLISVDAVPVSAPGLAYEATQTLELSCDQDYPISIVFDGQPRIDEQLLAFDLEPLDIWIDGRYVDEAVGMNLDHTLVSYHTEWTSLGLHHVRVGLPGRRLIVLDSDVIVDGINDISIEVHPEDGEHFAQIYEGLSPVKMPSLENIAFNQIYYSYRIVFQIKQVDGIDIPDGLDKTSVAAAIATSKDMAANYKKFLKERKRIQEKKKRGEALTDEEKKIDTATGDDVTPIVIGWKKAAGKKPKHGGTTTIGGKIEKKTKPKPKDPMGKLQDDVTVKLHEPSHLEALQKDVEAEGLDFDKWKQYWEVKEKVKEAQKKGQNFGDFWNSLSDKEKQAGGWGQNNQAKINKVLKKRSDPEDKAKEEIGEYVKEAKFFEAVLKVLGG